MSWKEDRPVVVGLGELLWDVFPDGKRPGGAPANVAYEAEQLGCQGVVVSRVGMDGPGDEIITFLNQKGVEAFAIQLDDRNPTGWVTVSFNEKNQPEYIIHEKVAWDHLEFNDDLRQLMQQADAVSFGTLAQRCPDSREAIHRAVQATGEGCLRVYDVNIRQHYYQLDWIETSLTMSNVVKLNDEEVPILAALMSLPAEHVTFARSLIKKFSVQLVCITRGSNGCLLVTMCDVIDIPGQPIEVADTVGAGDAFTAGLIFALLANKPLKQAGEIANQIGGIVASKHGGMPDVQSEFDELLKRFE